MYFTQKLLLVCVLTLGLYFAISYVLATVGFPLEEGMVVNVLGILLVIVCGWLVFGPLSRIIGPAPTGNPFGDASEDVRYACESGRRGFLWVKLALVAVITLMGLALLVLLLLAILK